MNQSSPYQTLKSKNDINSLTCVNTGIDKSTCCISYVPWPPFFGKNLYNSQSSFSSLELSKMNYLTRKIRVHSEFLLT